MVQQFKKNIVRIARYIENIGDNIDDNSIEKVIKYILGAEKIFVYGAGRSGLIARAFGMQLMHFGKEIYVVGETINPPAGESDLFIIVSGSGETESAVDLATLASKLGVRIIAVTSNKKSRLAKIAKNIIFIDSKYKKHIEKDYILRQLSYRDMKAYEPTLFEICALVVLESIIEELLHRTGKTSYDLMKRHANVEH